MQWGWRVGAVTMALVGASGISGALPSQEYSADPLSAPRLLPKFSRAAQEGSTVALLSNPVSLRPFEDNQITCALSPVSIEVSAGCAATDQYPACRWTLPEPKAALGSYRRWRNTDDGNQRGSRELVALVLRTAAAYSELFVGERLVVGDLDAPGPRHATHDRGLDVDLYLPGIMWKENDTTGEIRDNYRWLSDRELAARRLRVLTLGKILATCAKGQLRIYYNDPWVIDVFTRWFDEQGLVSPFPAPMEAHNELHGFHFHVTIAPPSASAPGGSALASAPLASAPLASPP